MHDYDAFIAAICAAPDDDLPRLIFADWLDERGEAERAEFIRCQCRLADKTCRMCWRKDGTQRKDGFSDNCGRCKPLRRRERELLIADQFPHHGNAGRNWCVWAGPAIGIIPNGGHYESFISFRRGFVEEIACSWSDWTRPVEPVHLWDFHIHGRHPTVADAIRASTPLRKVRLTTWPDRGQHSIQSDLDTGMTVLFHNYPGIEFVLPEPNYRALAALDAADFLPGDGGLAYRHINPLVRSW